LALAEIRLNRELDSQFMEASAIIPIVSGTAPPSLNSEVPDYNRVRLVVSSQNKLPLTVLAVNEYQKLVAIASQGDATPSNNNPTNYAIENQKLFIFPFPVSGSYVTLSYYMMVPNLNATTVDTNVFTQHHADLLLFAACAELSKFIVEPENVGTWESSYQNALAASNMTAKNSKMGSTPIKRQITLYAQGG
jgi:hypothetical protein